MRVLKILLKQWEKIVKQKHKKEKNVENVDTYYEYPLLLIEWDPLGIAARRILPISSLRNA
jgi:hypothetical protein